MTARRDTHFRRLYLHLFASAACVLPVASYVLSTVGYLRGNASASGW